MFETIQPFDELLFRYGNAGAANPVFDILMPFITNVKIFLVPYIVSLLILAWKGGTRGRLCVAMLVLTIVASDQLSSSFLKPIFARERPCRTLEGVRLLVNCGSGKSFPSSHAVNNFGAALIIGFFYRRAALVFFLFAASVAYSRVYCGVHYPFDITMGAIIGTLTGMAVLGTWHLTAGRWQTLNLIPHQKWFSST
jgi:undecaprenyl-diphosphatase